MSRRSKIARGCFFSIILSVVLAASCLAGAWTQTSGEMYNRLAINYYKADEDFDASGDRVDFPNNGDFSDVNVCYYMEYGLTPELTLITNLAYKYVEYENDAMESETYGIGDIDIGARHLILGTGGGALSAQGLVKIPAAYDETDDVPLGNGQYDFELRLLYGHTLYPLIPGYFNLEAGYRFRREEPADEFRYLAEMGMDFGPKYYGRVKLDGILGMGNEDLEMDINGNPTVTNDFDLGKLDVCIGWNVTKKIGLELAYTPAIYGENTAVGTTWTVAVVLKK